MRAVVSIRTTDDMFRSILCSLEVSLKGALSDKDVNALRKFG
jgi:hypothetical protein